MLTYTYVCDVCHVRTGVSEAGICSWLQSFPALLPVWSHKRPELAATVLQTLLHVAKQVPLHASNSDTSVTVNNNSNNNNNNKDSSSHKDSNHKQGESIPVQTLQSLCAGLLRSLLPAVYTVKTLSVLPSEAQRTAVALLWHLLETPGTASEQAAMLER